MMTSAPPIGADDSASTTRPPNVPVGVPRISNSVSTTEATSPSPMMKYEVKLNSAPAASTSGGLAMNAAATPA